MIIIEISVLTLKDNITIGKTRKIKNRNVNNLVCT